MSVGFRFPAGQIWDLNGLHVLELLLVQFVFMSHFLLKLSARLDEERPCLKRQGTETKKIQMPHCVTDQVLHWHLSTLWAA